MLNYQENTTLKSQYIERCSHLYVTFYIEWVLKTSHQNKLLNVYEQ